MMRFLTALLFALVILPAGAQAQQGQARDPVFNWVRYAVGTQPLRLYHAGHVRIDCEPMGEIRMVLPLAPQNGTVEAVPSMDFVNYGNEEPYKKCSARRTRGVTVTYKAREGYRGPDKFSFLLVYSDGTSRRYNVEMTVY
ncbi:MAG: hypothetical protein MUF11_01340 [Beijerinckiaceae bacterium]|jgi:hypothetical protein|nr:hypothetical protein [Beijerinckiaceae bacterium]